MCCAENLYSAGDIDYFIMLYSYFDSYCSCTILRLFRICIYFPFVFGGLWCYRISVVDFGLSDMVNIGRFGGFFRHNPLWRAIKPLLLRDFWLIAMDRHRQHCGLSWQYSILIVRYRREDLLHITCCNHNLNNVFFWLRCRQSFFQLLDLSTLTS
jgi:hypothetical protein